VPRKRRAAKRKQKKFNSRERAEEFLKGAKMEWIRKRRVRIGWDRELYGDFLRAVEELVDVPGGTLLKAVKVYKRCVSWREYRGGKYEAPVDRLVELGPRIMLALDREAREGNTTLSEAAEGIIWGWLEMRANREIMAQIERERLGAADLREMRMVNEALLAERARFEAALKRVRHERRNAKAAVRAHKRDKLEMRERLEAVEGALKS
jgi:hypothetical protein